MLLAAIVRRFGTDDGQGGRTLDLNEKDLIEVPKGESLTITPRKPETPGVTLRVSVAPVAEHESVVESKEEA
jgi:hypothetical protein